MRATVFCLALAGLASASAQDSQRFEPNQTRRTAARIESGDYKGLFCNADDWYAVPLPQGERLEASIGFAHANGDLDLELYDARGNLLAWSRGSRDEEVLSWDAGGKPATVFLRVHNAANGYELHVGAETSGWSGGNLQGVECWGSDWYQFDVNADEELRVLLQFAHADGDLDMELFDLDGNQLAVSSGREDKESLSWGSVDAARVLLHVYHVHRSRTTYSLTITQGARVAEDLAQVFREERPEGAGNDRMELTSGEVLRGRILPQSLVFVTPYADLSLPSDEVAGLALSVTGEVHQLVTVQGDRFGGFLRTGTISFDMQGLEQTLTIRRERVSRLVFGRRGGERSGDRPPHTVTLRCGDSFRGELLGDGDWELDLDFARVPVQRRQVESLTFDTDGSVTVLRRDQTATRGKLTAQAFELQLDPGLGARAPIVVHPSALTTIQLTETGEAGRMRPAQLRHLIRRIAPEAPRELVEAIAAGGEETAEKLTQLRTMVEVEERGNPQLARHLLGVEDTEVAFGWLEILARIDEDLRRRLVTYLAEAHRPEGPRSAAAEILVSLASESGHYTPLERACGSPVAANMVMQAAHAMNDQQVRDWLVNRVRRFRSTRRTTADADARRALIEHLPQLLEDR